MLRVRAELLRVRGGEVSVLAKDLDAARHVQRGRRQRKQVGGGGRGFEAPRGGVEELRVLANSKLQSVFEDKVEIADFGHEFLPTAQGYQCPRDVMERSGAWVNPFPVI